MDQLRKALAWLKKYHFWVLAIVIVVIAAACWYSSTGVLAKQFQANQQEIQAAFATSQRISAEPFHANPGINKDQEAEIDKRSAAVNEAWRRLYERQQDKVLNWPPELGPEFAATVEKYKFGDELPANILAIYRDYAVRHFPQLPKAIDAAEIQESDRGGMYRGVSRESMERAPAADGRRDYRSAPEPVEDDHICEWLDQQTVREQLQFQDRPSSLRVWVTQENLWAYHTLLNVIAATNSYANADRKSNAAVRTVEMLEVGKSAALSSRTPGRILLDDSVRGPATAFGVDPSGRGGGEVIAGGREGSGQPISREQEETLLLSGRYVDAEGKPLVTFNSSPVASLNSAEYKRLPVRMVLRMDSKYLSYLIAQCANQPLQIEVQEVRINPSDGGAGAGASAFSSSRERGVAIGVFDSRTNGPERFPVNENLVQAVVQGVIYIFNAPNVGSSAGIAAANDVQPGSL